MAQTWVILTAHPQPVEYTLKALLPAVLPHYACMTAQVRLLAKHIGKENDEIERVIARPTYFNPYEAVDYGIIDRVCPHLTVSLCACHFASMLCRCICCAGSMK